MPGRDLRPSRPRQAQPPRLSINGFVAVKCRRGDARHQCTRTQKYPQRGPAVYGLTRHATSVRFAFLPCFVACFALPRTGTGEKLAARVGSLAAAPLVPRDRSGASARLGAPPPSPAGRGAVEPKLSMARGLSSHPVTGGDRAMQRYPCNRIWTLEHWRRGWDSNPRAGITRPSDFESAPL